MRIAFLGTPHFAVPTLEALAEAGHEIVCAYSQPPRPSGRGQRLQPSPVQLEAQARGIEVRTPISLKGAEEQSAFRALNLDVAVVVAYGLLLPKAILEAPRLGCFNLHASLLPRWRGAAPIHRAIMAGDEESGAMVMRMDVGLDTGPVIAVYRTGISDRTTTGEMQEILASRGAALMVKALQDLAKGQAIESPQSPDGVTYAKKIMPEDARIDWSQSARDVIRHVHGLNPSPGAWTMAGDTRLKILRAHVGILGGTPGAVVGAPFEVACGSGSVIVEEVQRAGRGAQDVNEFARGFALPAGLLLT